MSQLQREILHLQFSGRHLQVAEPHVVQPLEAAVLTIEICGFGAAAEAVVFLEFLEQQDIVERYSDVEDKVNSFRWKERLRPRERAPCPFI